MPDPGTNTIAQDFTGLPIATLIGQPLMEAARVEQKMALDYLDYINKLAFQPASGSGGGSGGSAAQKKTAVLDVSFDRAFENNGQVTMVPAHMVMPLIGMVDTSRLCMEKASVDFTMSVSQQETSAQSTSASGDFSASYSFGCFSASISGHVATSSSNTRTSDKSAQYTIHAEAGRQPPAEGLAKFIQALVDQQKVASIGGGGK